MSHLVILTAAEEEKLLRAFEAGLKVQHPTQLFVWVRSQIFVLLRHELMLCVQFDADDQVMHVRCLNSEVCKPGEIDAWSAPGDGLLVRLARACRQGGQLPRVVDVEQCPASHPLSSLAAEIARAGLGGALVHGNQRLAGGTTFFTFFSRDQRWNARDAHLLALLLPYLHTAFLQSVPNGDPDVPASSPKQALSAREVEVLRWLALGKSNPEIGLILGLSPLTVKNHLQRVYAKLQVHNRVQALSRCRELKLLDAAPSVQAGRA